MDYIAYQIIGSHPHTGETGRIPIVNDEITLIAPGGVGEPRMFEVKLDNCPHGATGCYAQQKDVRLLQTSKPGAGAMRKRPGAR